MLKLPRISICIRRLTTSSTSGPMYPPLVHKTLPAYFNEDILGKFNDRQALVCRDERPHSHGGPVLRNMGRDDHLAWNFDEFNQHIRATARGLLAMGVQKGDRVAVIMGNTSAYACLQWACASIGAILVTINPAYRIQEVAGSLKLAGVQHLVITSRLRSSIYTSMLADAFPALANSQKGEIREEGLPNLRNLIVVANQLDSDAFKEETNGLKCAVDWRELLLWREDGQYAKQYQTLAQSSSPDDVINLQFTSGTTGYPKAVSLTHHNLLNNALSIGRCMHLTPKDIVNNPPPLFHCFGLVLGNLAAWVHGASIVYASEVFSPAAIVEAVVEERCTALHGVPTHFYGILAEVERRQQAGESLDLTSLRTGIAAGSPIPIELMKKLIEKINLVDLTNAYGMTETSPVSFQTTPEDPITKRVETVGKVQPHVRAKVIDVHGDVVPIGEPGELCVAGYLVQKGYWGDDEQTNVVMKRDAEDGTLWMHTGDKAIMDAEGYLSIVGRIKDIIIRGGENLFPVQIENALCTHPDIQEAAAIAVPDAKYGEVVGAWVVAAKPLTAEDVRKVVAERMNPQNAPAWVWFVGRDGNPDELPKTASGKVQKHILRDWAKTRASNNIGKVKTQL